MEEKLASQQKRTTSDNGLADKLSMRKLLLSRYLLQAFIVLIVLITIIFVACHNLIDKNVTGTLLGTAIGSVLRLPFRSNTQSKEDDKEK